MTEEFNIDDRPLAKRKLKALGAPAPAAPERAQGQAQTQGTRTTPAQAQGPSARAHPQPASPAPAAATAAAAPAAAAAAAAAMVDVGAKDAVRREAVAEGLLRLAPATVAAVRERRVKKGDPVAVAQVAGIQAVKATPQLLPLCHPIPITGVDVRIDVVAEGVRARVRVTADYKTGVEMEALAGVTVALLTVWDMTKYLEKDDRGQYPGTRIEGVRVVEKHKEGHY